MDVIAQAVRVFQSDRISAVRLLAILLGIRAMKSNGNDRSDRPERDVDGPEDIQRRVGTLAL